MMTDAEISYPASSGGQMTLRKMHVAAQRRLRDVVNPRVRLFVASFLLLYFELVMIRWIPGHVRCLPISPISS
jgi:hypothetical protein